MPGCGRPDDGSKSPTGKAKVTIKKGKRVTIAYRGNCAKPIQYLGNTQLKSSAGSGRFAGKK
ncbi:hypothetical protein GCM10023350_50300 [Nocardioides endophyticus]|uniref:DUF2690 domain-containing protein n=1 Tax=Nocardioides endophyticus TaxID=1353775 RepID=A0ABP8ZJP9_9ACTN